jgi:heat shock protein HslJ
MVDATGDWRLKRGTNAGAAIPLPPGVEITLSVEGSHVSGRSGCNQYGGDVVVEGGVIRFGPMAMTEMACEEPAMTAEAAYAAALAGVRAATRDGNELTLSGPGVELVYEQVMASNGPDMTIEIPPSP